MKKIVKGRKYQCNIYQGTKTISILILINDSLEGKVHLKTIQMEILDWLKLVLLLPLAAFCFYLEITQIC